MASDHIFVAQFERGGDGPRVAVKDCIDIAGQPTFAGSEALAEAAPAERDAPVIASILAGGGRIVGKTNMHELAYGVTGVNHWLGTPANPKYPALIPGGSSSGSAAAIAAGLADIAIGTDTGGSIRMPATCCGVFGLKPTFGRVSREGCTPAKSSLDCIGPLAPDVRGLEAGMALIDPTFSPAPRMAVVRLGWVESNADPEIASAVRAAVEASGATIVPVDLPGLEEAFQAGITIVGAECWEVFGTLTSDPRMGDDVRTRLLNASKVTPEQIGQGEATRADFRAAVDRALAQVDALVLPTLPTVPPAFDELGDTARLLRLTALVRPFNLSGHPALSLPIVGPAGRPAAIQLVGTIGGDEKLCAVAARIEEGMQV
jgi:amidase